MKKSIITLLTLLGVFILASCSAEKGINAKIAPENGFKLEIKVPTPTSSGVTKSKVPATEGECDINSLYILFFDYTTDGTGRYIDFHRVPVSPGQPLNIADPINIEFEHGSALNKSQAYSLMFVANIESYIQGRDISVFLNDAIGKSQKQMVERLWTRNFNGTVDNQVSYAPPYPFLSNDLLMSAQVQKPANEELVTVELIRSLARIDVKNLIPDEYDLVSASIWNAYPATPIWAGAVNEYEQAHTGRFYGFAAQKIPGEQQYFDDIIGKLYCFENFVRSPQKNPEKTTCLILGLAYRNVDSPYHGHIHYYRVNLHAQDASQLMRRNKAYNISIRGVNNIGDNSEIDAYTNNKNLLNVVINYWDLDDDGIIQFDGSNILSVPAKKINLKSEGDERVLSVFTYGQGNLNINQVQTDQGISASLSGNTLTITATPMRVEETERTGTVELSFGSLRAAIDISQSRSNNHFLNLDKYTLPIFGPSKGSGMRGVVKVNASGSWKAKIFDQRFTFVAGVNTTEIVSDEFGDSFSVTTAQDNDTGETKYSFVVVTLDDDPSTTRTIVLQQRPVVGVMITPSTSLIKFEPTGDIIGNTSVFEVDPKIVPSSNPARYNEWETILTGADADKFLVVTNKVTDPSSLERNTFKVTAKVKNLLNNSYVATLKVKLKDEPDAEEITLIQLPHTITVTPLTMQPVPSSGGTSNEITIRASDTNLLWGARVETTYYKDGSPITLLGHKAYFGPKESPVYNLSNKAQAEKMKISFPPLTQPGISARATVTITLAGTVVSTTYVVDQEILVPRQLHIQSHYSGYGAWDLTSSERTYFGYFNNLLRDNTLFGPTGVVRTQGFIQWQPHSFTVTPGTTIYNANYGLSEANERNIAKEWLENDHRNFIVVCLDLDSDYALMFINQIIGTTAYTMTNSGDATAGMVRTPVLAKELSDQSGKGAELWKYLLGAQGPFSGGTNIDINQVSFTNYDNNNRALTSWPATTIPVLMNGPGRLVVGVDPAHQMLIIGDMELFGGVLVNDKPHQVITNDSPTGRFMLNLIAYMVNSAQYGRAFTDRFK